MMQLTGQHDLAVPFKNIYQKVSLFYDVIMLWIRYDHGLVKVNFELSFKNGLG